MARNPRKIWDDEEVSSFRSRYREGTISPRDIAKQFTVSIETVRRMLRGETYFLLKPPQTEATLDLAALASAAPVLVQGEDSLRKFLSATAEARAKQPDNLLKEIFGEKPLTSDPLEGLPPAEEDSGSRPEEGGNFD